MFTEGEDTTSYIHHIKHGEKVGCCVENVARRLRKLGRPVTITTQETIANVLAASL